MYYMHLYQHCFGLSWLRLCHLRNQTTHNRSMPESHLQYMHHEFNLSSSERTLTNECWARVKTKRLVTEKASCMYKEKGCSITRLLMVTIYILSASTINAYRVRLRSIIFTAKTPSGCFNQIWLSQLSHGMHLPIISYPLHVSLQ